MIKFNELIKGFNPDSISNMQDYFRLLTEEDSKKIKKILENYNEWEEGIPFAISVFGEVLSISSDNYVILYKLMNNEKKILIEGIEMLQQYLSDIKIQKKLFNLELYDEVKKNKEMLKNNECYIYEPIPALGGIEKIDNIVIGDYKTYLSLILELL